MDEILSRELIENSEKEVIKNLSRDIRFDLPEKVLQFGTGGFLRGFTDYLIERANKEHLFNGSVLVVKSTPGSAANFARQDNLYTLNIRDKDINEFRSKEHTSELQSLMRNSYAVFCLKKKIQHRRSIHIK